MTLYLIDKSALARANRPAVRERLAEVLGADRAVTCPIVDLEMLYSARSPAEYELWRSDRRVGYENLPLTPEVGEQALAVQRVLAARGQHRGVSLPDLLIGACAAVHGATVLHYDADYDRIATETKQAVEWIVPRGSVD
ncbi:MAG: PIN domain nuclease [Pseudonocardia sp.]|nr:PIN domain nuclease [Pseudonocardia sp.]